MSILVIGMAFFSIYGISASVLQAAGKPYPAMYFLAIGTVTNLILTIIISAYIWIKRSCNSNYDCFIHGHGSHNSNNNASY